MNTNHGLPTQTVGLITAVFAQYAPVEQVILYGSRARGTFKNGSDIDLCMVGEGIDYDVILKIASDLDGLPIPYAVDLSAFHLLDHAKLREHIERVGVTLYERESAGLPAGWVVKTLGEVCIAKSSNVAQNKLKDDDGVYPIFGASGLIKNVSFYHRAQPYLSIVKDGSGVGRVTKMPAFTSVIGTLQYILPHDDINLDYLNYALMSVDFKKYVAGAAIPHIYFKDYKNEPFLWMPLVEQQRIVAVLDEAFAAIDTARACAESNLKNAKELFESYLQGVFEKKSDGWKTETLGDVCSLYQGIAINAKTKHALVEKSELPLLRIKDLKNNTEEQYIDPNNFPKNALVNESNIIYTRTGSLGLVFRGRKGVLHNNSFKVVPNSKIDTDFLFIWLQNPIFKNRILQLALKAAQPDITHAIFKIQVISFPPIKDQQTIVQKLDALSAQTQQLEAVYLSKIKALDELKKSILQKAFAGALNVDKGANDEPY